MWEGKETERLVKHFSGKWSKLTFSLLGWSIMWRKLHGRSRPRKGSVTEKSQRRTLDMSTHLEPATKNKHIIHNLGDVSNIQCIDSYRKSVTESQLVFWPQVHVEGFFFCILCSDCTGELLYFTKKNIKCSYSLTAVPSTITIMPATVQSVEAVYLAFRSQSLSVRCSGRRGLMHDALSLKIIQFLYLMLDYDAN